MGRCVQPRGGLSPLIAVGAGWASNPGPAAALATRFPTGAAYDPRRHQPSSVTAAEPPPPPLSSPPDPVEDIMNWNMIGMNTPRTSSVN